MASGNLATKIPLAVINSSAMMIVCKHCGVEKDSSEFYVRSRRCKPCCIKHAGLWKKAHPDKVRESARRYELKRDPDKAKTARRKWYRLNREYFQNRYKQNRDKIRRQQIIYAGNPEVRKKRREYEREYRQLNKEKIVKYRRERQPIMNEYKKAWLKAKRQTSPEFKQECYAKTRQWAKANRDKINRKQKEWRERNPEKWKLHHANHTAIRRARIRNARVGPVSYKKILQRDGLNCHICGKKVKRNEVSFDHLIPLSRGGAHIESNIAIAHLSCNVRRNADRLPAQLRLID